MTSSSRSRLASWVLACALPSSDVQAVLGDLEEEYATRLTPAPNGRRWYWGQVFRSLPCLMLTGIRRGGWVPTLGVAVGACAAQALIELTLKNALVSMVRADGSWAMAFTNFAVLLSLGAITFVAARIRPGAASMLGAIVSLAVVIQLVAKSGSGVSPWLQVATLLLAPSIVLTAGALSLRTSRS
jgi:hypothetical protein